ncbi:MAG: tetratricopeptide repeat protein, partial [Candidatus Omnitrophica bacterium]|nr:tetratricopeptide repeat protein [Candidatus Omnitrophota bacterium]
KLVIGFWLLFGYWCLVIGVSNVYALNLEKIRAHLLSGDYKLAVAEGERVLAATNSQAAALDELYYILGLSYLKDGNYLRASDIFEIILEEFKESNLKEEARLSLGDTYFLSGDYPNAEVQYQQILKDSPRTKLEGMIFYRLGLCQAKKGNIAEAEKYLTKLKQDFPLSLEARLDGELSFSASYYTVQIGSFSSSANANNLVQKLILQGYPAYAEEAVSQGKKVYRVRVAKLQQYSQAKELEAWLAQQGYPTKIYP